MYDATCVGSVQFHVGFNTVIRYMQPFQRKHGAHSHFTKSQVPVEPQCWGMRRRGW